MGAKTGRTATTTVKEHLDSGIGFGGPTFTKVGTETETTCPAYVKRGRKVGSDVRGIEREKHNKLKIESEGRDSLDFLPRAPPWL